MHVKGTLRELPTSVQQVFRVHRLTWKNDCLVAGLGMLVEHVPPQLVLRSKKRMFYITGH